MNLTHASSALIAISIVCGAALRAEPPATPEPAAAPAPAPALPSLAGPKVAEQAAKPVVERDFEGNMIRSELRPEVAVLAQLELSAPERAAVNAVVERRAVMMDRIVRENIELLVRAQTVKQTGGAAEKFKLLDDVREALAPLTDEGTFAAQIERALPTAQRARFNELNREYWRALIQEEADLSSETGKAPRTGLAGLGAKGRGLARAALAVLGQEVKSAYERIIADGTAQLDEAIAALDLTPEQEGRVRTLATDFFQKTKGNPTQAQRIEFFFALSRELTPAQRGELLAFVRDRG